MKKIISLFFMSLVLLQFAGPVSAQTDPSAQPHSGGAMPDMGKTGIIEGTVFSSSMRGQKTPVAGQEVSMLIFNNGQQVLMLKKVTDEKGVFTFKNIFMNPEFAYGFGTMYQDNLYVFPRLSLKEGEDVKKIDFQIGDGSPYWRDPATMGMNQGGGEAPAMDSPQSMPMGSPTMGGGGEPSHNAHDDTSWSKPYQYMAAVLGVIVLVAGAFVAGKKSA